jgi:DNA-binding transcriptional MerR regulator
VKTLRFYHEEGLLIPAQVDRDSGYRYFDASQIETARAIAYLRSLEFPLADIRELLRCQGDDDVLDVLERRRRELQATIERLKGAARSLDQFIKDEREAMAMTHQLNEVQEKTLEPLLVAGIRMKGRYSDCGTAFARIGRSLGRYISGKPLMLHYDPEYREDDADFEPCMPLRQKKAVDGISVRELPGGRCVSLVHKGPYDQLGRSYAKVFQYINDKGYKPAIPSREVYLKGPGMIFKGNPKNYLTEIQVIFDGVGHSKQEP